MSTEQPQLAESKDVNVPIATTKLSDQLSEQVRQLNKKLLTLEQEKEHYKSDLESIRQLFCQEMRITYDDKMSISEMKARFRGYRRREEEKEEARLVEHNRNVSELFATVRQNMKLYEKRINDVVNGIVTVAKNEKTVSEASIESIEKMLETLNSQKENYLAIDTQLINRDKEMNMAELTESNKKLRERIHVLEGIQSAIREEGSSRRHEEEVDLCSLQQEISQKDEQIKHMQDRISSLDAELGESERIRQQQHQQLLLITSGGSSRDKEESSEGSEFDSLRLQIQRFRKDQKDAAIEITTLKNRNDFLTKQVSEFEEELGTLRLRYEACRKERNSMEEKFRDNEKYSSLIISILEENNRNHKEEIEKVVAAKASSIAELSDLLKESNYYYRQKEYNISTAAYQKMEEYLMNRIRQLTNQMNRTNAIVAESLDVDSVVKIPAGMTGEMTKAELLELKEKLPVVNMCYLREVLIKFISFPRGSNERAYMYPVMKTLLSLGEREMRILRGDMSYKAASSIPVEKPLVKGNQYVNSSTLLEMLKRESE